jgi:polyferredoxin
MRPGCVARWSSGRDSRRILGRPFCGITFAAFLRFAFCVLTLLAVLASDVAAQEFLSRPEVPGYETPSTSFPKPRSVALEYLDVAALVVALGLASYFALVRRWRRGLFGLAIVSLLWFGFWRLGCVCAIGSIQNVSQSLSDPSYIIPISVVAFFAVPLIFTLFFGRTFCASVCPLGAVQELTALRPVRVPRWLGHALGMIPWVYLGLAVVFAATGTAFVICEYDPYVGFFRRSGNANLMIFGFSLLLIGVFVGRPYCRFLCPLGAVFRLCSKVSRFHLRIPPQECINCRLCEDVCPYDAIREPTVDQTTDGRSRGKRRLVAMLLLLPVLIALGYWLGRSLEVPLARMHPEFRLAERVRLEEMEEVEGTTDASEAFWNSGRTKQSLYADALEIRQRFNRAGALLGAWVGLVIGLKLVALCLRRRRTEYQPDRSNCFSCGRCFWYCPGEKVRLGLITPEEFEAQRPGRPSEEEHDNR